MKTEAADKFAVFAEVKNHSQPLLMHNLSFGKLMDEIVLPYQTDEPFFIDGAPVKRSDLERLKILQQNKVFNSNLDNLNLQLHTADATYSRVVGDQYHLRVESIFRGGGEDVTSQVISAFDREIKPSLKDYLPKREELIQGAFQFFLKSVTQLAGLNPAT